MGSILIFTSLPDLERAEHLAQKLVDARLAACVSIASQTSFYRWQGAVSRSHEHILTIKTTQGCYDAVEKFFAIHHPYDTPELLAIPIAQGLPKYLAWVAESTTSN